MKSGIYPSDETISKFAISIGFIGYSNGLSSRTNRLHAYEGYYIEKGINVEEFKDLMIRYGMKEYTLLILDLCYGHTPEVTEEDYNARQVWDKKRIDKRIKERKELEYKMALTEALIFLFEHGSGKNLSITFQESKYSKTIVNKDVIATIIRTAKKDYERNYFNKEYLKEYNIQGEFGLEFLKADLKTFAQKEKGKAGAKSKNGSVGMLAMQLSSLKRVDKFLNRKEGLTDLENIPLKDEDCRFIHDCLVFFKLIRDYTVNKTNTTTPAIYIRRLLMQADKEDLFDIKETRTGEFKRYKRYKDNMDSEALLRDLKK